MNSSRLALYAGTLVLITAFGVFVIEWIALANDMLMEGPASSKDFNTTKSNAAAFRNDMVEDDGSASKVKDTAIISTVASTNDMLAESQASSEDVAEALANDEYMLVEGQAVNEDVNNSNIKTEALASDANGQAWLKQINGMSNRTTTALSNDMLAGGSANEVNLTSNIRTTTLASGVLVEGHSSSEEVSNSSNRSTEGLTNDTMVEDQASKEEVNDGAPSNGKLDRFCFADPVHVLQTADQSYVRKRKVWNHINYNKEWAAQANYTYQFVSMNDTNVNGTACPYTQKVQILHSMLHDLADNEWIVFLDVDAHFTYFNDPYALDRFVNRVAQASSTTPCQFIAMSAPHTVNTAVMVIQATLWMRKIVTRWFEIQSDTTLYCAGAADQIPLQSTLLNMVFGSHNETPCLLEDQFECNECFKTEMNQLGYPEGHRNAKNVCLITCADRLQCNKFDCPNKCRDIAMPLFHHDRKAMPSLRNASIEPFDDGFVEIATATPEE